MDGSVAADGSAAAAALARLRRGRQVALLLSMPTLNAGDTHMRVMHGAQAILSRASSSVNLWPPVVQASKFAVMSDWLVRI